MSTPFNLARPEPQGGVSAQQQGVMRPAGSVAFAVAAPPVYFNGFGLGAGPTEITITLMNGPHQVGIIQANPSVLKELCASLGDAMTKIEAATGTPILKLSELLGTMQSTDERHE